MSLNRYERLLHDYIERHPDESRFWQARVIDMGGQRMRREERVLHLNALLWDYFEERAQSEAVFKAVFDHEGRERISMLNLSEYLLRVWLPAPAKKTP